jgi:phosphohistidine phosphatase
VESEIKVTQGPTRTQAAKKTHKLYLVRHAIAAERGSDWPDDAKRPLTPKGIARMRQIVRGLRNLDIVVDVVLTSPLVRAKQTAELLVEGLKPSPTLVMSPALAPGTSPAQTAEALAEFRKARRVALVGHEPGLGELAAWLVGANTSLPFKKGGIGRIDVASFPPTGTGQLIWLATPAMLRCR